MGTGMYMPPEQWKTTTVDIRADIYSLGCTLYHLLAGNPPFYDSDLRPEKAHEKSNVPMIRSSAHPLPKKLWDVLRRMLEKKPENRFNAPADVAAALAPFAEGNQLAALVRGHDMESPPSAALRDTRANGSSRVDTRKSRPWFSGVGRPSRRWMMQTALPIGLILLFGAAAFGLLNARAKSTRDRLEQEARDTLPSFAKHAATSELPKELEARFKVLTEAAQDPKLIDALEKLNVDIPEGKTAADALDEKARQDLNEWIALLGHQHGDEIKVESWFVNNKFGIQVARSPFSKTSVGECLRYRDYFHGLPEYIDPDDKARLETLTPITRNNVSHVYRSSTTKLLKVAFSVPIWAGSGPKPAESTEPAAAPPPTDAAAPPRAEPIGVLAMSVNVHDFKVLDKELAGGSDVVLIDLRSDWIEEKNGKPVEGHGLILHHPNLEPGELARVDATLLDEIYAARPLTDPDFNGAKHFLAGYSDPLAKEADSKYWGAFEPVRFNVDRDDSAAQPTDRVGWVVLVQKPM
jgi:hypothetical protein